MPLSQRILETSMINTCTGYVTSTASPDTILMDDVGCCGYDCVMATHPKVVVTTPYCNVARIRCERGGYLETIHTTKPSKTLHQVTLVQCSIPYR